MAKLAQYLFTARRVVPAMLAGPLTVGGRARLAELSRALGWERERGAWPVRAIGEVVGGVEPVLIYAPHERQPHNATGFELACLAQLARWRRPRRIFEFGTFDGRSSANLLLNAAPDARLLTINLPPDAFRHGGVEIGECLRAAGLAERTEQLYGDTLSFDFSPHERQMDLIFIDAGHSYRCVLNDSTRALGLASQPGALIVWHDYGQITEVTRAVDDFIVAQRLESRATRIEGTSLLVVDMKR
jgi:predicted O-methyltransferase YrrM